MLFATLLELECYTDTKAIFNILDSKITFSAVKSTKLSLLDREACDLFSSESVSAVVEIGNLVFTSAPFLYDDKRVLITLATEQNTDDIKDYSLATYSIKSLTSTHSQSGTVQQFMVQLYDMLNLFDEIDVVYNATHLRIKLTPKNFQFEDWTKITLVGWANLLDGEGDMLILREEITDGNNDWNKEEYEVEVNSEDIGRIMLATNYQAWMDIIVEGTLPAKTKQTILRSGQIQSTQEVSTYKLTGHSNVTSVKNEDERIIVSSSICYPTEGGLDLLMTINDSTVFLQPFEKFRLFGCITYSVTNGQFCMLKQYDTLPNFSDMHFECYDDNNVIAIPEAMCNQYLGLQFQNPLLFKTIVVLMTGNITNGEFEAIETYQLEPEQGQNCYYDALLRLYNKMLRMEIVENGLCILQQEKNLFQLDYLLDGAEHVISETFVFPSANNLYDITLTAEETRDFKRAIAEGKEVQLFIGSRRHTIKFMASNIERAAYANGLYITLCGVALVVIVNVAVLLCGNKRKQALPSAE